MAATLHAINPQFAVTDVVKTAEYYRDFLGFTISGYWMNPPVYAIVERDGVTLHFGKSDQPQPSSTTWRPEGLDAYIRISGIHDLFEEFKSKGIEFIDPICAREYGMIEFTIKDCNGFVLVFGQDNSNP